MKVLKFGGSSLATPERMRAVGAIVLEAARADAVVVVVSAFQGVTNQLLDCARIAERGDRAYETACERIAKRHLAAVDALVERSRKARVREGVEALVEELHDALHGIHLLRHCPPRALDVVGSFGERLSALIFAAYLSRQRPARFVDARECVVTDNQFTHANVIFNLTNRAIRRHIGVPTRRSIPIVTGFIGATVDGKTTTIGRNGSDYSAAIFGAALDASVIEIWTDVDGVLSADPRAVPSAFVLPEITYEEAMELSYFGAKVLHSAAIAPAVAKGIPLLIKNSLNPQAPGTVIARVRRQDTQPAKGISSVGGVTLLTLRGLSMVGVPGVAERLFRALAARGVNVVLISQASSEHTICFAVNTPDGPAAVEAISQEFRFELEHRLTALDQRPDQAIIAVVGDGMKGRPGIAGSLFGALGRHNINISAIAQGASERNISCVVDAAQQSHALNVIHQRFFETRKSLALVVVGVGNIGGALLRQLHEQRAYLRSKGFDLRVIAVANSRKYVLNPAGLNLERWQGELSASRKRIEIRDLARRVGALKLTNAALVDCTASPAVVDAYPEFVNANLHIITPNKRANVLPWPRYTALVDLLAQRQKHFLYEANVGAGLPVMSTLRDLIASGDRVDKVEGILSGTLSYLFNTFDGSAAFSELVHDAHAKGLTEPDPRDDLSGEDVARKLLILAREIGWAIDIKDIEVESLANGPFTALDRTLGPRLSKARARGNVLRYVGTLENGRGRAGIQEFARDHPFATTRGSDNIIAFTTKRYSHTPLVLQGPGAGADVTAMGVFSDLLKLLHYLPE